MAKFTKKWLKEFEKRMKNHFKELETLENEYQEMVDSNPDQWELNRWSPMEHHTFKKSSGLGIYHNSNVPEGEEYIEIGVSASSISGFAFPVYELKELIEFRNRLTEAIDAFERPIEKVKETVNPDECEDEEGWEDNEEQEYTIQCSRTCVQSWTHTVMARSTCEAYRKAQEGEGHDENDDFDNYGEIDYESI